MKNFQISRNLATKLKVQYKKLPRRRRNFFAILYQFFIFQEQTSDIKMKNFNFWPAPSVPNLRGAQTF